MKTTGIILLAIVALLLMQPQTSVITPTNIISSSEATIDPVQEQIDTMVEEMSLEEKVGQMLMVGYWGENSYDVLSELVDRLQIGGVMLMKPNITTFDGTRDAVAELQARATHVPLLVAIDQEGGIVSRIDWDGYETTAQKDIRSVDHATQVAIARAKELRDLGITVNFAPVLEHITNPDSFLFERVFQGSVDDVIAFGAAMVDAYQSHGVAGTVKHFPGHADDSADSHALLPVVDIPVNELDEHIQQFQEVIHTSDPKLVMMGHVLFPEIDPEHPSSLSKVFIEETLRDHIGFDGVVITDDMQMGALTTQYDTETAAVQAVVAGNDILLYVVEPIVVEEVNHALLAAVETGVIAEERIDASVRRILELKLWLNDSVEK